GIIIGGTAALALMVATLVTIRAGALAARAASLLLSDGIKKVGITAQLFSKKFLLLSAAISIVVAAGGWLIGWLTKTSDAHKEFISDVDSAKESAEGLRNEISDSAQAHKDNQEQINNTAKASGELVDRLM